MVHFRHVIDVHVDNKQFGLINIIISGPDCHEVQEGQLIPWITLENGKVTK